MCRQFPGHVFQFKWLQVLRARYDESQAELTRLRTICLTAGHHDNPDAGTARPDQDFGWSIHNMDMMEQDSFHKVAQVETERKRRSGSLAEMMTELLHAQEQALLAHCTNGSKICLPGAKGHPGAKGEPGLHGSAGLPGVNGTDGPHGIGGAAGVKGTKGDTGSKGDQGPLGIQGPPGKAGLKGDPGIQGQKGDPGVAGPIGTQGAKGAKGDTGPTGPQGVNGTDGQKGDMGPKGVDGAKGDPGPQGTTGPPGVQLHNDCMCIKQPKIDVFPSQTTYPLGSTVNLTCDSTSSQLTSVMWDRLSTIACPQPSVQSKNNVITSLQPSDLGTYQCTAVNPFGSVSKTITIRTNDTKPLDCDFEQLSKCNWANSHLTDTSDWLVNQGQTPSPYTGPDTDHTLGTNQGHYLFIESSNDNLGTAAEYQSPQMHASNGSCLTFWYNMYGHDIGTLNVYTEPCIGARKQVFQLTGDQGQGWHETRLQLTAMDTLLDHRIILQSIHGRGVQGDTAIDDIEYYPGTCKSTLSMIGPTDTHQTAVVKSTVTLTCPATGTPPPTRTWEKLGNCGYHNYTAANLTLSNANYGTAGTYICTVTNGASTVNRTIDLSIYAPASYEDKCAFEGTCDWRQDTSGADHFDWSMQQGPTQSADTGPDNDHTLANANGHYMYIETSSPRQAYDKARLISHVMPRNQSACFSFWYNMYGSNVGHLTVFKEEICTHQATSVWTKSGDQGRNWVQAAIDIFNPSHDYVIVVEATAGTGYHGDIGIDDLLIMDDSCIHVTIACDFDRDTCKWQQGATDQMNWDRGVGQTMTVHTGPDGDHTGPNGNGHYMYIETSLRNTGDFADLISPVIPGGITYCLHIATNMYGAGMGSIQILMQLQAPASGENLIQAFLTASPQPIWVERSVELPPTNGTFQIIIRGIKGTTNTGDAAIDDVKLHSGKCR